MKFIWREKLTVIISEMSRATALDCARNIDQIPLSEDSDAVARSIEAHIVSYAPTTVIDANGKVYQRGEVSVEYAEGERVSFTLPLTPDGLLALPVSLANLWADAALAENQWIVDGLKNVLSRVTPNVLASQPGSDLSDNSKPTSEATRMTG